MMSELSSNVSRRDFLKRSGILAVGFSIGARNVLHSAVPHPPPVLALPPNQIDSWLVIASDGSITVFSGKV